MLDLVVSETISHNPRVKVIHDFLTADECEQLIASGRDALAPSYVVGKKGNNEASQARSSSGTFLTHHTDFIRRIEQRIGASQASGGSVALCAGCTVRWLLALTPPTQRA